VKTCRFMTSISALLVLAISLVLASAAQDKERNVQAKKSSKSIGFILSADANEHDLGLPSYPGSRRHKDNDDDSSVLRMGLWGGGSGFKLLVLKLDSSDAPQKVARFYHKPLSRYGKVVDCGKYLSGESKDNVNCENDHPVKGGYTFEAGSKEKMHVVGIEPNGKGSLISLMYVETPKSSGDTN
jgi:hypothetical protein